MKPTMCFLILLLAGCATVTPDKLRSTSKFTGTYQYAGDYESTYRELTRSVEKVMRQIYPDYNAFEHMLYPERKAATLYRWFDDQSGTSVTMWLIDVQETSPGTCGLRLYAINGDQWGNVVRIVQAVPGMQAVK